MKARTAAGIGAAVALLISLGLIPLFASDDGQGGWVDAGLVVVAIGAIAVTVGPLVIQIRQGIVVFAVFLVAEDISDDGASWFDFPSLLSALGTWGYAFVTAGIVVLVVEVVRWVANRRRRPAGSDSSTLPSPPT